MFSGSYLPDDVTFLLKRVLLAPTPVEQKERLIQSGKKHYSEMISAERLPSPKYLDVFHQSLERQKVRFAHHLLVLARLIAHVRSGPVVLVSLARAGTPVGVLLARTLRGLFGRTVAHYSISIIRDRGIDENALRFILTRHEAAGIVFVDGWTGKGVIANELLKSVRRFNERVRESLDPGLFAVADLCGEAEHAATAEDYLIPSSVLGCTISGLVSRSILNAAVVGPGDFHGCLYYEEFETNDLSRPFVDQMTNEIEKRQDFLTVDNGLSARERDQLRQRSADFVQEVRKRFGVHDVNHIKPGIGEATRVLLRRVPDRLLLREKDYPDTEHLRVLAEEKGVPIEIDPALPYQAAALIREVEG